MGKSSFVGLSLLSLLLALPAFAWEGVVDGNRLACDFVADGIVRVQYALGDKLQDNGTGVVLKRLDQPRREGAPTTFSRGNLSVTVDPTTGRIVFTEADTGRILLAESATVPHAGKRVNAGKTTQYQVKFNWQKDESLYGLGQHIEDYLDLRGKQQFLTQHNLKVAVPVLVSTRGYGLLFDAGSAMRFDDREGAGVLRLKRRRNWTTTSCTDPNSMLSSRVTAN